MASNLLVCSNRGPYTFEGPLSSAVGRRGGGGLISVIAPATEGSGATWIAAALSNTDRQIARSSPAGREQSGFTLRFLDLPKDLHHLHYDVMSNEVLWFLFHYLFDAPHTPTFDGVFDKAWGGYRRVNELFAEAVVDAPSDAVLFQDYHLMLAAAHVRRRKRVRGPLIYFHHVPWCEPVYFSMMPAGIRAELLEGMLAHDVVGFHARMWADAFLRCCEAFLPNVRLSSDEVRYGRRTTKVFVAAAPIDAERLRADAAMDATRSWIDSHDSLRGDRKLLLRVDRIDLSKNPLRGFLAFEELLRRRPALASEVLFLALMYPSRLTVERYQRYYGECLDVVRRVNERYEKKMDRTTGPIHLLFEDDFARSVGALCLYDVLLVNPVFDGLNLVSKEGAVLNERDGTVVLSRNAGSFEQIGRATVAINPFDVPATADAIEHALEMRPDERTKQAAKLRQLASVSSPREWLDVQLAFARA